MENQRRPEPFQNIKNLMLRPAVAIVVIFCFALAFRLYLIQFHDIISVDGTSYVGTAKVLRNGNIDGLSIYGFYPVLIWLFSLTGVELETAGHLVSAIAGSLLVIPVYLLGVELFSQRTAFVASILIAVWSTLVAWSCEIMPQALYITLAISGIYLVWSMMKMPSPLKGFVAGTLLSLAFLTRPEGFLLIFVLPLIPLFIYRHELRPRLNMMAFYAATFLCFFCLNLFLVHHVTGHWQLSAKTGTALADALGYYLQIQDFSYLPEAKHIGYLDIIRHYPGFILANTWRNFMGMIVTLLPVPVWLFALVGFCSGGREKNVVRLFLISACAPLAVIMVFYIASPDYAQQYLPVFFLCMAEGGVRFERWLVGKIPIAGSFRAKWISIAPASFAICLVFAGFVAVGQIPANTPPVPYDPRSDDMRRDQKNIGLLLKKHLPPGKIMTRWPRIAYYADRDWTPIPHEDLGHVLGEARKSGVRFIIVDGNLEYFRPEMGPLYAPFNAPDVPESILEITPDEPVNNKVGLRPYLFYMDPTSLGVIVYELVR